MDIDTDLKKVYRAQKEIISLSSISMLLDWDQNTHMPEKAYKERSSQLNLLEGYISKILNSQKLYSLLLKLKDSELKNNDFVIITEFIKIVEKERKIPKSLTKEITRQTALNVNSLEKARKENNYEIFKKDLNKIVELKRKYAESLNKDAEPYDVLLNEYEDTLNSEKINDLFKYLKKELKDLLDKITKTEVYKTQHDYNIKLKKSVQKRIIKDFTGSMGIPHDKVSFDKSSSSFMMDISRFDLRIATNRQDNMDFLFSVIHEIGHALYVLGLPHDFKNTFLYDSPSISFHESQSLLWEFMIAKSEGFWEGYNGRLKQHLSDDINWKELYKSINLVRPSPIRSSSGDLAYCLHIIIRFEIERDLINGVINTENLNLVWNKKVEEAIGLSPLSDREGILQDSHWSEGEFGYFPTYLIGMIYAAQIYKKMQVEIKDFENLIKEFNFIPIVDWLKKNIYSKGKIMTSEQLIKSICKEPINPEILINILKEKYFKLYDLK